MSKFIVLEVLYMPGYEQAPLEPKRSKTFVLMNPTISFGSPSGSLDFLDRQVVAGSDRAASFRQTEDFGGLPREIPTPSTSTWLPAVSGDGLFTAPVPHCNVK